MYLAELDAEPALAPEREIEVDLASLGRDDDGKKASEPDPVQECGLLDLGPVGLEKWLSVDDHEVEWIVPLRPLRESGAGRMHDRWRAPPLESFERSEKRSPGGAQQDPYRRGWARFDRRSGPARLSLPVRSFDRPGERSDSARWPCDQAFDRSVVTLLHGDRAAEGVRSDTDDQAAFEIRSESFDPGEEGEPATLANDDSLLGHIAEGDDRLGRGGGGEKEESEEGGPRHEAHYRKPCAPVL